MSEIVQYAICFVRQFLSGEMDLEVFAENLGGFYLYSRQHPEDGAANALAGDLMNPYAQFSGGYVSEAFLRDALESTIRPLIPSSPNPVELGFAVRSRPGS